MRDPVAAPGRPPARRRCRPPAVVSSRTSSPSSEQHPRDVDRLAAGPLRDLPHSVGSAHRPAGQPDTSGRVPGWRRRTRSSREFWLAEDDGSGQVPRSVRVEALSLGEPNAEQLHPDQVGDRIQVVVDDAGPGAAMSSSSPGTGSPNTQTTRPGSAMEIGPVPVLHLRVALGPAPAPPRASSAPPRSRSPLPSPRPGSVNWVAASTAGSTGMPASRAPASPARPPRSTGSPERGAQQHQRGGGEQRLHDRLLVGEVEHDRARGDAPRRAHPVRR